MSDKKPYYLTTAIAYVNAPPHIGFALELIYTDVMARYQRLAGKDVRFLTGTDEHGQKIALKAAEAGKSPEVFTTENSALFRELGAKLLISNDDFIRTTEERHKKVVAEFWKRVDANGFIYKKKYGGLYCVGCEQFKPEKDLVDGLCPDHKKAPEYLEEENYFFKLTAFKERLQALFSERPDFVIPSSKFNEMKQLVEELEDISISRSREHLAWGIPVPGDDTQVVYVWFDALTNYLSGCGFMSDDAMFARYWPANAHVVGKEINRFHSVLWPAMLMAADLPVPRQVAVHGWITVDGQKMSKSLGNVVEPEALRALFGADAMRYLFTRYVPFMNDGDYSEARFKEFYGADLANNLGNLVYRVTSMLQKYFDGKVAVPATVEMGEVWHAYRGQMEAWKFDQALEVVWKFIQSMNQHIDDQKPWTLAKAGETEKLAGLLALWLEQLRQVGWMLRPFMPEISDRLLDLFGTETGRDQATFQEMVLKTLAPGQSVAPGQPLFPRLETEEKT